MTVKARQGLIDPENDKISVNRQCNLIGLNRSSYYYQKKPEDPLNIELMKIIDRIYTKVPSYGSPRITDTLRALGYNVNHKRIERLMRKMGIAAICPKPKTSIPEKGHKIYPYLLKGVEIKRPNQVWSTDITYIPTSHGFVYLTAVMDWYSRFILSWEISNTMDRDFCIKALKKALLISKPEIFNSDQGSQFTSREFTGCLKKHGITISMDGKGRAFDNIFIERLWRSVKYEEVYLHSYQDAREARAGLEGYFDFYNNFRRHSSLGKRTPGSIYNNAPEKDVMQFLNRSP